MNKNETYQQTAWRLSDLFTGFDDPNIAKTYQLLEEMVSKFEEYRDSLTLVLIQAFLWTLKKVWRPFKNWGRA